MASLNTLRTKFGIVLSIVIAGALLAFILSLKTEMGFSGNDPRVGVIDGEKINYSEYYNQYEQVKAQSGAQESNEQQSAMLANAAWQALIGKYVLTPGFDKMGLRVTEPERMSMVSGQHPSQAFYNAFADPRTGEYNVAAVHQFLSEAEANAQAQQAWAQLNEQARMEREVAKFLGLIKGGVYVNSLEVANGVNSANNTYAGKWAGKKYSAVPDSLIQLKSSDIKAYYNSHKNMFKQTPSRALSYVVFEVTPTDDDMLALEKSVAEVGAQFAATEELKSFVRANRNGKIADSYVSAAQLSEDEAKALLAGETYGPVLKNNQWTMARVLDSKMVPDTLGIRHIVLPYTQEALADSLLTVIKGGADFAQLASQYSVYEATAANGGEVGVVPFSAFTGEFVAALANAKRGDVVKVASGDAIQLMQVYRADKPSKHIQIASITYPVEASAATLRDVHNQASTFAVNAKGSAAAFNEAASKAAVTPRIATNVNLYYRRGAPCGWYRTGGPHGPRSGRFARGGPLGLRCGEGRRFGHLQRGQGLCDCDGDRDRRQRVRFAGEGFGAGSLAGAPRQEIRLYRQGTFGRNARRAGRQPRFGGGGVLRCDFRVVLCERRGCRTPSGRCHRIG